MLMRGLTTWLENSAIGDGYLDTGMVHNNISNPIAIRRGKIIFNDYIHFLFSQLNNYINS